MQGALKVVYSIGFLRSFFVFLFVLLARRKQRSFWQDRFVCSLPERAPALLTPSQCHDVRHPAERESLSSCWSDPGTFGQFL